MLYRRCGNLVRATWGPESGETVTCHRSNRSIVVETTTHHANKSSDDTSRYLRVSIATEATTCDSPPLLSPASNRSPSGLIWSTPFSPPSHSATVLIRGRVFFDREPKLATLVETFHPSGLHEPKSVSIPAEPASLVSSQPKLQRRERHQPRFLRAAPKSFASLSRRRSYCQVPLSRLLFCDLNRPTRKPGRSGGDTSDQHLQPTYFVFKDESTTTSPNYESLSIFQPRFFRS